MARPTRACQARTQSVITGQAIPQAHPLAACVTHRRDRQLSRVVVRIERGLAALRIQHLPEVALLVQQPDANHRHAEVAGGLELVAGDVAEPARVDRQRLAEQELHAEIRDAAQGRRRICLLEPSGCLTRLALLSNQRLHLVAKCRVATQLLELGRGSGLQDDPRAARQLPQLGLELVPQLVGAVVPRPAHVERQLSEVVGARNLRRRIVPSYRHVASVIAVRSRQAPRILPPVPGCPTDRASTCGCPHPVAQR